MAWKNFDKEFKNFFEIQVDCVSYPTHIHIIIDPFREVQEICKTGLPSQKPWSWKKEWEKLIANKLLFIIYSECFQSQNGKDTGWNYIY